MKSHKCNCINVYNRAREIYISVTREPEQVTAFQSWPHGSPPLAVHRVRIGGEFKLVNMAFRADTAEIMLLRYLCVWVTECVQVKITITFQRIYPLHKICQNITSEATMHTWWSPRQVTLFRLEPRSRYKWVQGGVLARFLYPCSHYFCAVTRSTEMVSLSKSKMRHL